MENRHTKEDLVIMQALPLDLKVRLTEDRIRAWVDKYGEDGVCVSFSGGKDSTVLLHIVRNLYPDIRAVFSNTGLEYPEIRQFAMSHDKVDIVYPDVRFKDVITEYGYPLIGKEVAEAIYYARRIGGGAHTSETPRLLSQPTNEENSHFIKTSHSPNRRTILTGKYPPPEGGGVWDNYHRRCLAPNPNEPKDRKCFWNNREGGAISKAGGRQLAQLPTGREKATRTQRLQSRGSDTDGEYP